MLKLLPSVDTVNCRLPTPTQTWGLLSHTAFGPPRPARRRREAGRIRHGIQVDRSAEYRLGNGVRARRKIYRRRVAAGVIDPAAVALARRVAGDGLEEFRRVRSRAFHDPWREGSACPPSLNFISNALSWVMATGLFPLNIVRASPSKLAGKLVIVPAGWNTCSFAVALPNSSTLAVAAIRGSTDSNLRCLQMDDAANLRRFACHRSPPFSSRFSNTIPMPPAGHR